MPRLGLSEKLVYVFNPLPNVDPKDLYQKAGIAELMDVPKVSPFAISWTYGVGHEKETVHFLPKSFVPLRPKEAVNCIGINDHTDMGLVIVEDPNDVAEVTKAARRGVQKAYEFYNRDGVRRLNEMRRRHQFDKEEWEEARYQFWCYWLNAAKAEVLRAELSRLRNPKAPIVAPTK